MDFTAIWGIMPDQAPHAIRTFGNVQEVEDKVVQPQIASICRNNGSKYSAVQLLVGEDREQFQQTNLDEFQKVLSEKEITLLYGLVRHIYIPKEVRQPIQTAFIADELKLTREQEQITAKVEAELREAEKKVELESEKVLADTTKKTAEAIAEGDKQVGEIAAETRKLVAAIEKQTAELEAQATLKLGQAENDGKRLVEEATADRFRLAVEAFGTPAAYNNWVFATGLPDDVDLKLLYAGEGTLWTDMQNLGVRANLSIDQPDAPAESSRSAETPGGR
jgi:regulator of protease activity HflC (stomatin/prohibitin superfamily)